MEYFLGANYKYTEAKIEHDINVYVPTPFGTTIKNEQKPQTLRDDALELKLGVILNRTFRVYLSAVEYKTELLKIKIIMGNYEYLLPITDSFRLFSGFHLGTFKKNMIYGLQAGAIYDITKNIEFEIGGQYSKFRKNEKIEGEKLGFKFTDDIKIKNSSSFFTGFNFKF